MSDFHTIVLTYIGTPSSTSFNYMIQLLIYTVQYLNYHTLHTVNTVENI